MRLVKRSVGFILLSALASLGWALDESVLWLPKSYQQAMPKLVAVARAAEKTHRCRRVIAGRMLTEKSTANSYYFIITCSDKKQRTYTLSYQSPVGGEVPTLVAEQRPDDATAPANIAAKGVTRKQASLLCKKGFATAVGGLDDAQLLEKQIADPVKTGSGFSVAMPFTTPSDLGNRVLHRADCSVSKTGETHYRLALQSEGALTICKDYWRSESILLGRSRLLEKHITKLATDRGFHFTLPFIVDTLQVNGVHYLADCHVNNKGESTLTLSLQPEGAFTLCAHALRTETLMMKEVSIADKPVSEKYNGKQFSLEMVFSGRDFDGDPRKYRAFCQVDHDGETTIRTELDKSSIVSVCISGLREKTSDMIDVKILKDQVPPLQQDHQGYLATIPFDAKNPQEKLLHYQAECRIDENGQAKIHLRPRYLN